jgi:hypothetical protein
MRMRFIVGLVGRQPRRRCPTSGRMLDAGALRAPGVGIGMPTYGWYGRGYADVRLVASGPGQVHPTY